MTPEELQEFENRFNQASNLTEKQEIASEFVDVIFPNAQFKDVLVKLCVELDTIDNSFTTLLDGLSQKNLSPTRKYLIALNNLYANDVIDDQDLEFHGNDGVNTILINPQLAKMNNSSDIEFLIKSYYWLSNKNNLTGKYKDFNYNGLKDIASIKGYSNIVDACNSEDRESKIRNAIMFSDEKNPQEATIRDRKDIEDLLHAAARRDSSLGTKVSKSDEIEQSIKDLSREERLELFKRLQDANLL